MQHIASLMIDTHAFLITVQIVI